MYTFLHVRKCPIKEFEATASLFRTCQSLRTTWFANSYWKLHSNIHFKFFPRGTVEAKLEADKNKLKRNEEIKPESNSLSPHGPCSPPSPSPSPPPPPLPCIFIPGLIVMSGASLRQAVILFNRLWTWQNTSQRLRKTSQVLYLTQTSKALVWLTGSGGDQCLTGTGTHYLFTGLKRCFASFTTLF